MSKQSPLPFEGGLIDTIERGERTLTVPEVARCLASLPAASTGFVDRTQFQTSA